MNNNNFTQMDKGFTNILFDDHPAAKYIAVVDENGNEIPHIKSYNTLSRIAEMYKIGEDGKVEMEWNDENNKSIMPKLECGHGRRIKMITRRLEGSRIVFRISIKDKKDE